MVRRVWRAPVNAGNTTRVTIPLDEFIAIWLFFGINILSPGPNVLNTIGTAMGSGRRAGLACALAVGPGVAIWSLATVLGVAALFRVVPWAETLLTAIGAALLIWFATRFFKRARLRVSVDASQGISVRRAFFGSLAILATNPKAMTTWLVILSVFPVERATLSDMAILVIGSALLAVAGHVFYAVVFSTRPAARIYARWAPAVNAGVGVFFLFVAAKLIRDLAIAG
jgi:threonine/homoserine/homoserine lactone efflux protein